MSDHAQPSSSSSDRHHHPISTNLLDLDLLTQAARLLGQRCQEGVPLCSIPPHSWWVENHRLHIPYPGSAFRFQSPPDRDDVETALIWVQQHPGFLSCSPLQRFRLLHIFARSLPLPETVISQWKSVLMDQEKRRFRHVVRHEYSEAVHAKSPASPSGIKGVWKGKKPLSIDDLASEVQTSLLHPDNIIKKGIRATVWTGRIQGNLVVIKKYEKNPRPWRRPLEICRAKRAWAGANALLTAHQSVPKPLGWIELTRGPEAGTSYFINEPIPPSETVRVWLRREWKHLTQPQRIHLRHALRKHFMDLYTSGLVHLDCKLSNLLIPLQSDIEDPVLIWTDLEDIRPQWLIHRTFLRNLYQINGSLPRDIPARERELFLKGFTQLFPFASSSWVSRYIRRITRKRHRRELRRQCGA